jgi:hypothetical protein
MVSAMCEPPFSSTQIPLFDAEKQQKKPVSALRSPNFTFQVVDSI